MVDLSNSIDRFNGVLAAQAIKVPCVVVSTADLTLSGEQTVNSVAVVTGDRVLVNAQTDGSENGIYDVQSTAWCRSADFDGNRDVLRGTLVIVYQNAGADAFYSVSTDDPITIGSTDINFTLHNDPAVSYPITTRESSAGLIVSDINDSYPDTDARRLDFLAANTAADNKVALENMALVGGLYDIFPGTYAYDPDVTFAVSIALLAPWGGVILQPSDTGTAQATLIFSADDCTLDGIHFDAQNVFDYQCVNMSGDRAFSNISGDGMGAGGTDSTGDTDGSTAVITGMTDTSDMSVGGLVTVSAGFPAAATDAAGDTDGSTAVITGMADTSDFTVGRRVTASAGFASSPGGTMEILSKDASSITVDENSTSGETNITVTEAGLIIQSKTATSITVDELSDSVESNVTVNGGVASGNPCILVMNGDQGVGSVTGRNCLNTGGLNASHPRLMSISATTVDTEARLVKGNLVQVGLSISSGATRPKVGRIEMRGCEDNGLYDLGSTDLWCGDIVYWGRNEACALVGTTNAYFTDIFYRLDAAAVGSSSSAISINDITNVRVGHIDFFCDREDAPNAEPMPFRTRSANTASVGFYIDSMTYYGNGDGISTMANGTVDDVVLKNFSGEHHWFVGQDQEIITLRGDQFVFENWNIKVIDDSAGSLSGGMDIDLPVAVTKSSYITNVRVIPETAGFSISTSNINQSDIYVRDCEKQAGFVSFGQTDPTPAVEMHTKFLSGTIAEEITDFDRGSPGQQIMVISKSDITYSFGGNLTGSSMDVVTALGDITFWLCEDGTTWILMGFVDISADNSGGA